MTQTNRWERHQHDITEHVAYLSVLDFTHEEAFGSYHTCIIIVRVGSNPPPSTNTLILSPSEIYLYGVISYRPSGCVCYLQVLSLLLDADFSFIRSQYFNVRNLQDLFRSVGTSTIIDYIKAIQLFDQGRINPAGGPRHHRIWGSFWCAELRLIW